MPCTIVYLEDAQAVEATYSGRLSAQEFRAGVESALALAAAHRCRRFLTDCTALESGPSVADLYEAVEHLEGVVARPIREAILLPAASQAADGVSFWETATRNRGFAVQAFVDRESALAWLARSLSD